MTVWAPPTSIVALIDWPPLKTFSAPASPKVEAEATPPPSTPRVFPLLKLRPLPITPDDT